MICSPQLMAATRLNVVNEIRLRVKQFSGHTTCSHVFAMGGACKIGAINVSIITSFLAEYCLQL
jgi:hypothetical protein